MSHLVDHNDLKRIREKGINPIGFVPCPRGDKGKINPHVTQFVLADGRLVSRFHIKPIYYETLDGFWRPLSEITSFHGNRFITLNHLATFKAHPRYLNWLEKRCELIGGKLTYPNILSPYLNQLNTSMAGLTTTTVYPDPHTETSTVDGYLSQVTNVSWADGHDAATADNAYDDLTNLEIYTGRTSTGNWAFKRGVFLFDTSSVGSDTISSANLDLYNIISKINQVDDGLDYLAVVSSAPASNTALVVGDFDSFGTTEFSDQRDLGGMTLSTTETYTFNASGIAAINGSGISKFGVREGHDITDTPVPTSGSNINRIYVEPAEGTNDPALTIVHAAASSPTYNALAFCAF